MDSEPAEEPLEGSGVAEGYDAEDIAEGSPVSGTKLVADADGLGGGRDC